jgi:hypothetical protein
MLSAARKLAGGIACAPRGATSIGRKSGSLADPTKTRNRDATSVVAHAKSPPLSDRLPFLRDSKTGKDRDFHTVQDQSENQRRSKFTGNYGNGQRRHGNAPNG